MDLRISGKVALVTGGSRGLGRQSALSLAQEGANVAICGRNRATLDQTAGELRDLGVEVAAVIADVSDASDVESLHREVVQRLGPVDILVNNVGGSRSREDLAGTPLEDFKATFDLNLFGGYELMRLVIPGMRGAQVGSDHQHRFDLGPGARRQRVLHVGQGRADRRHQARWGLAGQGRHPGQ